MNESKFSDTTLDFLIAALNNEQAIKTLNFRGIIHDYLRLVFDESKVKTDKFLPGAYRGSKQYEPSKAAQEILNNSNKYHSEKLTVEHMIPLAIGRIHLTNIAMDKNLSPEDKKMKIISAIETFTTVRIITKEEDLLIRKVKLNSKMPQDWIFGDDILARHKIAGII